MLRKRLTEFVQNYFFILVMLITCSFANAKEYRNYDPKRMLTVSEAQTGKQYAIDLVYLDQMLNDLAAHAINYPPRFDTPQEKQHAIQDVKTLSGMLDILIDQPKPNTEILVRAGWLNSMGHNLDISGSSQKTVSIFEKLLAIAPAHPRGNYMYGNFLAGAGKPKEALPYLEKALTLGVSDASYSVGMTYLSLGKKDKALKNLQDYKRRSPSDTNVDPLIEAIRSGKFEFKNKQ